MSMVEKGLHFVVAHNIHVKAQNLYGPFSIKQGTFILSGNILHAIYVYVFSSQMLHFKCREQ